MKQVLLRVAAMFAKIGVTKFSQPLRVQFLSAGKILLPQNAVDPNVDRKGAQAFVGEKHYAIGDLRAYAGQLTKLCPKIDIRKRRPRLEVGFA
jgi:hypothetical protein